MRFNVSNFFLNLNYDFFIFAVSKGVPFENCTFYEIFFCSEDDKKLMVDAILIVAFN